MASTQDTDPLARHALSPSELKELLARERDEGAFLAFRDGEGVLRFFALGGSEEPREAPVTIGRRAETDIVIAWDAEVSGVHAELHALGGELTIVDDGLSRNGTYLNGVRIGARQRLRDGDRIRIGRTVLAYRAAQATLLGETVLADERSAPTLTDGQRRVLVALCRPYAGGAYATPATNQEIAEEVFLSVDAVKMHLRALFGKFELGELPQNQKRARLAELALQLGAISRREIE